MWMCLSLKFGCIFTIGTSVMSKWSLSKSENHVFRSSPSQFKEMIFRSLCSLFMGDENKSVWRGDVIQSVDKGLHKVVNPKAV